MQDRLDQLYKEALAEYRKRHGQKTRPYVVDLIEVLWSGGENGLPRTEAIGTVQQSRRDRGLEIPLTFKQAVQSEFNRYCTKSSVFKKRAIPSDGLFSSRRDGQSTYWIVNKEEAAAWLIAKNRGKA